MKRFLMFLVALLLIALALLALFPQPAVRLLADSAGVYPPGLSMAARGHVVLLCIGLIAAAGAAWPLLSAVRS
jgi:hypothetical protein